MSGWERVGCNHGDEWAVVQAGRVRDRVACVPLPPPGAAHLLLAGAHLWVDGPLKTQPPSSRAPGKGGQEKGKGRRQGRVR